MQMLSGRHTAECVESVTQKVKLAPSPTAKKHRNIVVAIDDSLESIQALSWALDNVVHEGDKLALVTIEYGYQRSWSDFFGGITGTSETKPEERGEEHKEKVKHVADMMVKAHQSDSGFETEIRHDIYKPTTWSTTSATPNTIVEMVKAQAADVLIMGSTVDKRGDSVSQAVARSCPCPVVIVRGAGLGREITEEEAAEAQRRLGERKEEEKHEQQSVQQQQQQQQQKEKEQQQRGPKGQGKESREQEEDVEELRKKVERAKLGTEQLQSAEQQQPQQAQTRTQQKDVGQASGKGGRQQEATATEKEQTGLKGAKAKLGGK